MSAQSSDAARSAWQALQEWLASAEARIVADAPRADIADEGLAYLGRFYAAGLARALNPAARTINGLYYSDHMMAGANPEYRIGQGVIDPVGRYRLSGRRNGATRVAIGLYTPTPGFGLQLDGYATTDDLPGDAAEFAVEIGPGVSADGGLALSTKAGSALILTRELRLTPDLIPADLRLERVDAPLVRPGLVGPTAVAHVLVAARAGLEAQFSQFHRWSSVIANARNTLVPLPAELGDVVRGDPETCYTTGAFDLSPGRSLEITVPAIECRYWMVQAVNYWIEPIPGAVFNHTTAQLSVDGDARFIIGPSDPGQSNWLDTRGRTRGAIFFRTVGAASHVVPQVREIASPDEAARH